MSKILLITGGSRGIGAATARLAAARGYDVAINYAGNAAAAESVVADIRKQSRKAVAIQADVSKPAEIKRLFEAVDKQMGRIDAFFNNAGIAGPMSKIVDMPVERIEKTFAINTVGAFIAAQEAVRRLSTRLGGNGGAIVNMSSMAAKAGAPNDGTDYGASKGAIDTLTVGLAKEVAGEGIRVNAVRPGLIYTEIHAVHGPARSCRQIEDGDPDAARRHAGRGRGNGALADVGASLLHHWAARRCRRRTRALTSYSLRSFTDGLTNNQCCRCRLLADLEESCHMTVAAMPVSRFVLGDEAAASGKAKAQALSPILIGGVLPIILAIAIDPFGLGRATAVLVPLLIVAMLIAVGVYTASVLIPGELAAVVVDTKQMVARLNYQGMFATRTTELPLSSVASVKANTQYDRDGYRSDTVVMTLRTGERLELPPTVTPQQIRAVRAVLGL